MDTVKVRELIAELRREIEPKLEAIRVLENLLLGKEHDQLILTNPSQDHFTIVNNLRFGSTDSYVNLAIALISANESRPMSVNSIVEKIRAIKNNPGIERRSVESTLYQHTKSEHARLVKVGRGMYGLKRSPREESAA